MTMTTHSATEKDSMVRYFGLVIGLLIVLPTVAQAQTETVVYFHTDAVGSVRMTTDASGQVIQRYDYAPFGEPLPAPTPETRRFAGGELDPETELNYFGARQYHPQTGRFSRSDDPGYGNPFDPQSMNFYAYAVNNPLRWVDPTGHSNCPVIPGFTIDDCTEVTAPDRLAPYLPYLIQWLLEQRPNYPGGGGGGSKSTKPTRSTTPPGPVVEPRCLSSVALAGATVAGDALFLTGAGAAYRIGVAGVRQLASARILAQQIGPSVMRKNVVAQVFVQGEALAGTSQVALGASYGGAVVGSDLAGGIETVGTAGVLGFETSWKDIVPIWGSFRALGTVWDSCS
jgi:RHS repeat-associated protein